MSILESIRIACVKRGNISMAELARRTGQTAQNLNNKYKRNVFKVSELEKIAAALDCELRISFVDKETGEILA
ncbi:helix-turn-helix transcriptional regulator [uncultured Treponema sp.]|uniref:helix-turn-helix domain-containing protein n=1 Tax=uncultured Treponema sp. TaxID=162155 RepID=UPI0025DED81F|nr:helix-turn-helix transcriptional regulator [uncultured Treponema sp.]